MDNQGKSLTREIEIKDKGERDICYIFEKGKPIIQVVDKKPVVIDDIMIIFNKIKALTTPKNCNDMLNITWALKLAYRIAYEKD